MCACLKCVINQSSKRARGAQYFTSHGPRNQKIAQVCDEKAEPDADF